MTKNKFINKFGSLSPFGIKEVLRRTNGFLQEDVMIYDWSIRNFKTRQNEKDDWQFVEAYVYHRVHDKNYWVTDKGVYEVKEA